MKQHSFFRIFFLIGALTICFGESAKAQAPGGVSSGMVLWLKANQGTSTTTDNQPVSFWNDQSGNGNNAIQLTPLSQPRYKKQAFNGNPAIEFNVGNKFMNVNLSQIDNHDYTVYVVAKRTGSTPNGYLFGVQQTVPNPGLQFGYDTNTSLKLEQYGNSITQPVTGYNSATETPVILSAMFNTLTGKSMSEVEEGVLVTGSNSNTASYLQGAQGVIGRGNSTTGFKGLISEIIAYNRILTAAERKDIESYLAIKYGITLPNGANKFYADAAFSHDVAGIGRDVAAQGLDQQSSKSENADGILYVDNASDLQDGEYFVWGNDNRSHSFIPEYTNCAVSDIYDRSWKINETGEVGTVKITYNVSGVTGIDPNDIVLLIDDDGDGFAEENPIYGSYAAPNKVFSGLNFQTGYRFTIAVGVSRYYAVASGNASGAVWSKTPGGTPQVVGAFCDKIDLIVQSGFTITNDLPDLSCNDFTLEAGATFNLGTNQLSLSGDGVFFGTLNASSGTIACNGVAPQAIAGGSLDFYNWNCINPSFVTITATQVSVHGYLSVTAGELKTTGKLTMASDATSTGMIGPLTTGNLTGTVTVMRYHNALAGGWVNLCSPIQNKTIMDWDDDLITTGFTGSDFPSYPFNNVQQYIETQPGPQNAGFVGTSNVTDPIQNRKGYFVYMNSGVMNLDVMGSIFKGNMSMPVTYTNTGNPSGDGWNLVGNPYACTIDWDSPTGMVRTNMNNALYIWDASINQYASYVAGVGNNGGTRYIPPTQSFWVVANAASPALSINENAKVNTQVAFKSTENTPDVFNLSVSNGLYSDQATLYFNESASLNYDPDFDAFKLVGPTENLFMSTVTSEGYDLSVNSMPRALEGQSIPVRIKAPQSGNYVFVHKGANAFSNGSCVTLRDLETGEVYDLTTENKFSIYLHQETEAPRFVIEVGAPVLSNVHNVSCPDLEDGSATVTGNGSGPWNFTWKDGAGEVIQETLDATSPEVLANLVGGYYSVTIGNNGVCASNVATFYIETPEALQTEVQTLPETCSGFGDGYAFLSINGGSGNYDVLWSNGTDNPVLNDVNAGIYTAFITDEMNCTHAVVVEVPQANPAKADFYTDEEVYELKNGAVTVDFHHSGTTDALTTWDFGDGTIQSTDPNPTHLYNASGNFTVTQSVRIKECEVIVQKNVIVEQPSTATTSLTGQVTGTLSEEGILLRFSFDVPRELRINAYNILGQRLIEPIRGVYTSETLLLSDKAYGANALVDITDVRTGERTLIRVGS